MSPEAKVPPQKLLHLPDECIGKRLATLNEGTEISLKLSSPDFDPLHAQEAEMLSIEGDAQRLEQVVTNLQMLGYLPEKETNDDSFDQAEIDNAISNWDLDYKKAVSDDDLRVVFEGEDLESIPWEQAKLRYLKATSTFEGEIYLNRIPRNEERSLLSRISNLRLISYGLSRCLNSTASASDNLFTAESPFGDANFDSLAVALTTFGLQGSAEVDVLNILGHAPAATDRFLERYHRKIFVFVEESPTPNARDTWTNRVDKNPIPKWVPRWESLNGQFQMSNVKTPPLKSIPSFKKHSSTQPTLSSLKKKSTAPLNIIALELLQLRLWMLGYYKGEVDGKWGDTHTGLALKEFLAENKGTLGKQIRCYREGEEGWRSLNLYKILSLVIDRYDIPSEKLSIDRMNQAAEEVSRSLNDEEWKDVHSNYKKLEEEESKSLGQPTHNNGRLKLGRKNKKRKRYPGWRSFFSGLGAFFKKIGNSLKSLVQNLTKALIKGAKHAFHIFRYIWKKARIAVRIGRLAAKRFYHWISGTPIITQEGSNFFATRWSFDHDTVQIVSKSCPDSIIDLHSNRLDWMKHSFRFMCDLGGFVLSMIIGAASVIAWLRLAYKLFNKVREMLNDKDYRNLFSERILEKGLI